MFFNIKLGLTLGKASKLKGRFNKISRMQHKELKG